jgi:hypothetical protein
LDDNRDLRGQIVDLETQQDQNNDYLTSIEPFLVDGRLLGEELVVFDIEGSDGDLFEAFQGVVEEADGEVASRIEFRNGLELNDETSIEELAALLGSELRNPARLRLELADLLGRELGGEASGRNLGPRDISSEAVEALLQELNDQGLVGIERFGDRLVPPGADFVIIGGNTETPTWSPEGVVRALGAALDNEGRRVLVAETSDSVWELVDVIRSDEEMEAEISTVDNAETIPGRIDVALALGQANPTPAVHLGTDEGAEPAPTPPG